MYYNDPTIAEMPTDECWDLLRTREVGRLGVNADGFPQVLPMNYALDGSTVVVRSRPGAKLRSADGQPVSFEIDDIDEIGRAGWSVLVKGRATLVPPTHEARASTEDTMVQPWAPGEELYWMRIDVAEISGRRITPGKDRAWRP